jgi:hypothetical protein
MFKRWARKAFEMFADFVKLDPKVREVILNAIGDKVER